jgi:hypothetical protein
MPDIYVCQPYSKKRKFCFALTSLCHHSHYISNIFEQQKKPNKTMPNKSMFPGISHSKNCQLSYKSDIAQKNVQHF